VIKRMRRGRLKEEEEVDRIPALSVQSPKKEGISRPKGDLKSEGERLIGGREISKSKDLWRKGGRTTKNQMNTSPASSGLLGMGAFEKRREKKVRREKKITYEYEKEEIRCCAFIERQQRGKTQQECQWGIWGEFARERKAISVEESLDPADHVILSKRKDHIAKMYSAVV